VNVTDKSIEPKETKETKSENDNGIFAPRKEIER
jgi:hypothetical protein